MMTTIEGEYVDSNEHERRAESYVLAARMDALKATVDEMKTTVKELVNIVGHLARIDERQMQATATTDRISTELDELRKEVQVLQQAAPANASSAMWIERAIIALVAATLVYIAKETGLL